MKTWNVCYTFGLCKSQWRKKLFHLAVVGRPMSHSYFLSFREFFPGVQRQNWQLTLLRHCDEIFLDSITQYSAPRARSRSREKVRSLSLDYLVCPRLVFASVSPASPDNTRAEFRSTSEKKLLVAAMIDWILTQRRGRCFDIELAVRGFFSRGTSDGKINSRRRATIECKSLAFVERNQSEAITSRKMKGKTVVRGMRASNCLIFSTILNDWQIIESGEWTVHKIKRKTICSTLLLAI